MTFFRALLVSTLAAVVGCSSKTPETAFVETAINTTIVPAYQQLAERSQMFSISVTNVCTSSDDIQTLQNRWHDSMAAWQSVQGIQFGPIRDNNTTWEMQFWPDKKNLVGKKLRALLKEDTQLTQEQLQKSSVVVRGLPALEYLLFDPAAGEGQRNCEALSLIAQHQAQITQQLHNRWQQDYRQLMLTPGPDNPEYPEPMHAVAVIIDSYASLLDQLRDRKLTQALGLNSRKPRLNGYLLESWRSQTSRDNLKANLAAFEQLMNSGGLSAYLQEKDHGALATELEQRIQAVQTALQASDEPLFKLLQQQQPDNAIAIQEALTALHQTFKTDLPQALGIRLGFNDNDGD
ncbi:imelysin family protein [Pseudomaricurvus alkylphenolicus]|jgi:predicted lipoprotein|uniref:imelysin family protein n=1 Tax=Pseudomaricurvus alkylphenolicus TaxID=1306991 RepID=UPI0014202071|nr:imelysin family protein [Pseudomaricurvus alkylphenolicus]NIB39900.1 imelysin family protein [Pseudomaricurvus alkylphenolicus]